MELLSIVCSPPSGTAFPVGANPITCIATDSANHTQQCTFTISVTDTESPQITCPADITTGPDPGQSTAVVHFNPTLDDNCSGQTTLVCTPMSGFAFPIGATTVRCTATDPGNNTASRSFTITVTAAPPLSVVCPADIVTTTDPHACSAVVDYPRPSVAIRPSGATVQCLPASGSTFPKGNTTVTCNATDTSGNTGSCSFTVTVNDVEPPVLTCPSDLTVPCLGQVPPPSMAGSVTDNCDSNPVVMHVGDAVADSASVST